MLHNYSYYGIGTNEGHNDSESSHMAWSIWNESDHKGHKLHYYSSLSAAKNDSTN